MPYTEGALRRALTTTMLATLLLATGILSPEASFGPSLNSTVNTTQALTLPFPFESGWGTSAPGNRRTPVRVDPIEAAFARTGEFDHSGWEEVRAEDGVFRGAPFRGGYFKSIVQSDREQMAFLEASGHSMVYVNGEPRAGDVYGYGYLSLPVKLREGENEFVFLGGRGELRAQLEPVEREISFHLGDPTLPDVIEGFPEVQWAGLVVRNATEESLRDLQVIATASDGTALTSELPIIGPMTIRKMPIRLPASTDGAFALRLERRGELLDASELELRVRTPRQSHKVTFISHIDGSVQYYAVQPSTSDEPGQALFLTLHGASVEAIGQADAYSAKTWGHIVAPTNRRPFGFNWEGIGRLDGLEVLAHAQARLNTDPQRVYLTGHSMGGHGVWHFGSLYPGKFAAIAPAAAWISYDTYAGGPGYDVSDPVQEILQAMFMPSDTLSRLENLRQMPTFILHGDADVTVPVSEARRMRDLLSENRTAGFAYHEEPGEGHWYDLSPEPGADAVDFAPIFEFFARHRLPESREVRRILFTATNESINPDHFWVRLLRRESQMMQAAFDLEAFPHLRRVTGTVENVGAFQVALDPLVGMPGDEVTFVINEAELTTTWPESGALVLLRSGESWTVMDATQADIPLRFSWDDVWAGNVFFSYSDREGAEYAYMMARFQAETFYYIGNGSVDVVPYSEAAATRLRSGGARTVIHFGPQSPTAVFETVGRFPVDLTMVDVRPPFSLRGIGSVPPDAPSVMVSPTSMIGARSAFRLPLFTAGAWLPDLFSVSPDSLERGFDAVPRVALRRLVWSTAPERGGVFGLERDINRLADQMIRVD